ncbi:hypothetical protein DPMN_123052 [Dreissena polymorpha]|uniref:Uncharacterized protein n=1 Tax=Dreissena polymorpha TaxID=45954 RepID=A0A9D4GQ42_DREPO|nr:hypothetical protein DPMN_123052 [Dreissena polymorpha]
MKAYLGQVNMYNSWCNTMLQDKLDAGRRRGRQNKTSIDNVKERTSFPMDKLLQPARNRLDCR